MIAPPLLYEEAKEANIVEKKKSSVNIVLLVVCIAIAVAAIVVVGIVLGWFNFLKGPSKAKITMEDYSRIEVSKDYVTVNEEEVTTQINSYLENSGKTEVQTSGIVEDGDYLNISYLGVNALTGAEIDSNEYVNFEIGSGTFIPGFEEGLIGEKIGSTVAVDVTFPNDYVNESMRGLKAHFMVTINERYVRNIPTLTKEWMNEFSQMYYGKSCSSEEEFRGYVKDELEKLLLYNAMKQSLEKKCKIESYDAAKEELLMNYAKREITFFASSQSMTNQEYVESFGYASEDDFAREEAHYFLKTCMMLEKICNDLGIEVSQEELDESLDVYRLSYGDYADLDAFKADYGEARLYLYEWLNYRYNLVMEKLIPNVTYIE